MLGKLFAGESAHMKYEYIKKKEKEGFKNEKTINIIINCRNNGLSGSHECTSKNRKNVGCE